MKESKPHTEELPNEFETKEKSLHINFWLNTNAGIKEEIVLSTYVMKG